MHLNMPMAEYRNLLGTYLRPQRVRVTALASLLIATIGLQLLNPQIIRTFIDTTQAGDTGNTLIFAAAAFILVGFAQSGLNLLTHYLSLNIGWTATNALRTDLTVHLLRLDMPFHKTHTPGELIERVDGDVTALANLFSQFTIRIAANSLLVLAVLVLLFREDWRAGLGLTIYASLTLFSLAALQNFGTKRWTAKRQADAEQYGFIEERISGTEDIRAVGAENHVLHSLYALMRAALRTGRSASMADSLSSVITNFLFIAGYGLGLGLGAYLYTQGSVTIGTAFLIVYYIGMLAAPLEDIRHQTVDLQQARASIQRVQSLLNLRPEVQEAPPLRSCPTNSQTQIASPTLPAGPLSVSFDRVSFLYNDMPTQFQPTEQDNDGKSGQADLDHVLTNVSMDVRAGRVLGVLGRTGSGKTTLTRLIFRLYDPTRGTIRLGSRDLRDLTFADLRARIGMVTQDVQLFQASIRDNITFFDPQISDQQIHTALSELELLDWVASMPDGLNTRLAGGGSGLSAGEAQLLAFARVFLKDPGLIILDEAASRLDPITERLLERAVDRLLEQRTGIVIAHRLRTVQRADDILVLEGGRIVEFGPREQLAEDPTTRFYSLLRTGLEEAMA
ncbi:MAG: ABC transporter ATP-binding protein [Chloroflexia bacterium]